MIKLTTALTVLLLALAACGPDEEPTKPVDLGAIIDATGPRPSDAERTMREGFAPTPFSADQIREGCPDGRVIIYRISEHGGAPVEQTFRFGKGDAEGVSFTTAMHTTDGKPLGQPTTSQRRWEDLQQHASFPTEAVTIEDVTLDVAGKRYACWLYTQQLMPGGEQHDPNGANEDQRRLQRLWFAKALPGPPVQMIIKMDGRLIHEMVLHENRMP